MRNINAKAPNIIVVGDIMVDHYLFGRCERISPEAPVQVVDIHKEEYLLGGVGNVINNLLSLGVNVGICSVIGDDKSGEFIKKRVKERGIKEEALIEEKERKTTKKSRIIALHQQILRVDKEDRKEIQKDSEKIIIQKIKEVISNYDALLLSDYAKGVLTPFLTKALIKIAKENKKIVLVDPKGKEYEKYQGATLITPNKKEASIALNMEITNENELFNAGMKLKKDLNIKYALITLSEEGMAIFDENMTKIPTAAREVFDVTGAGDTVLAALGYALCIGKDIYEAAEFANFAAGVVVSKVGSASVTLDEIQNHKHSFYHTGTNTKIKTLKDVLSILQSKKRKIVFTNGCFDILHAGHVKYLEEAKSFADILIVGLNSDDSVKRLKGKNRPINSFEDRARVLAALECVDFVVGFGEDTPYELIKAIKPDILVKGGDYKDKEVVGSDIAKKTVLVSFVEGKSTSLIIQKAKDR